MYVSIPREAYVVELAPQLARSSLSNVSPETADLSHPD